MFRAVRVIQTILRILLLILLFPTVILIRSGVETKIVGRPFGRLPIFSKQSWGFLSSKICVKRLCFYFAKFGWIGTGGVNWKTCQYLIIMVFFFTKKNLISGKCSFCKVTNRLQKIKFLAQHLVNLNFGHRQLKSIYRWQGSIGTSSSGVGEIFF